MQRNSVFWVLPLMFSLSLVCPTADAQTASAAQPQQHVWLQVLDKVLPVASEIIKVIFQRDGNGKLENKVKQNDAKKKLDVLSEKLKSDVQPVNGFVGSIIKWRGLMDELNGVGKLPENGSFRGSLLQILAIAELRESYSDVGLAAALTRIEKLNGQAKNQWDLIWAIAQDQVVPDQVRLDLVDLRTEFKYLATSIDSAKKATSTQKKKSAMFDVANYAQQAMKSSDRLIALWDNWLRALGFDFLEYMKKFGATPDSKIERENAQRPSATLELGEAEMELRNTNQRLAEVADELKLAEYQFQKAKQEAPVAAAMAKKAGGGGFTSAADSILVLEENRDSVLEKKSRLEKWMEFYAWRIEESKKNLEKLRARPIPSAEDVVKALSAEGSITKEMR